jgi:hypothetical protein
MMATRNKGDVQAQGARWYAKNKDRISLKAEERRLRIAGRPRPASCEICGDEDEFLVLDHDHQCCPRACAECVRGWICQPCNKSLGFARDDPDRLISMVTYLLGRKQSVGT